MRGYASRTHNLAISSYTEKKYKIQVLRSSSKSEFFIKMTETDDRKTYQQMHLPAELVVPTNKGCCALSIQFVTIILLYRDIFHSRNGTSREIFIESFPSCSVTHLNNIFKKSVATSQKTQCFSIEKPYPLVFFTEIFAVYCENRVKSTNTLCGQNAEI
jgi:hypothetical protein